MGLFADISAEIWIKQKLHNSSYPSCYETKSFTKKHFLKKFTKLTFVINFTVNVIVNCQLHCLLPLLVKPSCSTPSYQKKFIRSCICISLIERENTMAALTIQLELYELFPEFQWSSFMEIAKQITGTYKFCIAEQGIFEIIGTYVWNSSYFDFWCIWNNFFFKQSHHGKKDADTPANKWDLFNNYFLEKLLLTNVFKYPTKFWNYFWKTCLTESLPVNALELQSAFLFKKRLLSEIISKVAFRKCSLKWLFIWNIS